MLGSGMVLAGIPVMLINDFFRNRSRAKTDG